MKPTLCFLTAAGFPSFWKRSLDEFKRLSAIAIKLEGLQKAKNAVPLWDFTEPASVQACVDMSDNDVGGFSQASITHTAATQAEPAHACFTGHISNKLPQEDNKVERTGYAAWRTRDRPPTMFGRSLWDVDMYTYLALRVRTDGRKYKVNIQTESIEYTDLHQHRLYSRTPGKWETVLIKWSDFVRTNHGIVVEPQSEMLKERVRTIGVGLTDRQPGPFNFRISKIWATNGLTTTEIEEAGAPELEFAPREVNEADGRAEKRNLEGLKV